MIINNRLQIHYQNVVYYFLILKNHENNCNGIILYNKNESNYLGKERV